MQCVILAAGKGTRMRPLTDELPKPLITVCGKTILDHIVEALPSEITELILVVGYRAQQIKDHCGAEFHGRTVRYAEQGNFAGGTGAALSCAREFLTGSFMVLNGDDIHGSEALSEAVQTQPAILSVHSKTPELFGVLEQNIDGTLKAILEKPKEPTSDLVNTGGFVADVTLFDYVVSVSASGELYATDMLTAYAADHPVKIIEQNQWLPIGCPEHIAAAEAVLCPKQD